MGHEASGHAGHDKHEEHPPEIFRKRFWLSFLLSLPILYSDMHFQEWFGYQAVTFPGVAWVQPLLSVALVVPAPPGEWMPARVDAAEVSEAQRGRRLYEHYCAVCHGLRGTGQGRNAPYLEEMGRAPTNHTDMHHMNRLSDAELFRVISEGKRRDGEPPFMPWWGHTLTEQSIWDLVAFIRSLARTPTEAESLSPRHSEPPADQGGLP
jgi:mono/diheme cytochrome c family protein